MRARRRRALRGLAGALAVCGPIGAILACNSLVGVEEVTERRRDGGRPIDEEEPIDPPPPEDAKGRSNVLQVALGEAHTCARKPDGTVKCWGSDDLGQTGSGGTVPDGIARAPVDVVDITDAVDIAAGRNHTCVARQSGIVSCWGYNVAGQLGNGEAQNVKTTPVDVPAIRAVAVAAGGDFSCAIRTQGTVACWGGNDSGQLGRGDDVGSTTPVAVAGLTDVIAIAAGQAHACAVKSDGSVYCWGDGSNGQLGYGMVGSKTRPVEVESFPPAQAITAGQRSTCALTRDGQVHCWGANEVGQLGTGAVNDTANPAPIAIPSLSAIADIGMGRNHACAARESGSILCWGTGARGQLGDGQPRDAGAAQVAPVTVSGVETAIGVGAGGDHSCAPTATGGILCWGANDRGQLGNGTTDSAPTPVDVVDYP